MPGVAVTVVPCTIVPELSVMGSGAAITIYFCVMVPHAVVTDNLLV